MTEKETIFLTGGTGFLGGYLAPALVEHGYRLRALVRPFSIPNRATLLKELGCEIIPGDLHLPEGFAPALEGVGTVIHLAAIVEGGRKRLLQTNWQGTAGLVRVAGAAGVERIVHLSSLGATPNPRFPYVYSAWLAEEEVRRGGLRWLIFRPSILVGPGDPFTGGLIWMARGWPLIPLPRNRAYFQPLWVGDLVRCILQALEDERLWVWGRIVELGGPEVFTLEEMARSVMAELGVTKPIVRLPRRPLRSFVRALRRLGLETPYVEGHLIGIGNVTEFGTVEAVCGGKPRRLHEALELREEAKI